MKLEMSEESFAACSSPVRTTTVRGSALRSACGELRGGDALLRRDVEQVELPSFLKRCCAVGTSKPASVAPPIPAAFASWMIPASFRCSTGPSAWIPIVSPTRNFPFFAAVPVDHDLARRRPRSLEQRAAG